jgi:hypothetical protein
MDRVQEVEPAESHDGDRNSMLNTPQQITQNLTCNLGTDRSIGGKEELALIVQIIYLICRQWIFVYIAEADAFCSPQQRLYY